MSKLDQLWSGLSSRLTETLQGALDGYRGITEGVTGSQLADQEAGFRRLTSLGERDLNPITADRAQRMAYFLFVMNPTGRRVTELVADYVIGNGFGYHAGLRSLEQLVGDLWHPSQNNIDGRQYSMALETGLFGEQLWTIFGGANGLIRIGRIDPGRILSVTPDPRNHEELTSVKVAMPSDDGSVVTEVDWPVIRRNPFSTPSTAGPFGDWVFNREPEPGEPIGCFFWKCNSVSNALRGFPDLLPVIDWIDAHDKFLFNGIERSAIVNSFIWHVIVKGGKGAVRDYAREVRNTKMKPGTIKFTNHGIEWKAITPDFGGAEHKRFSDLIRRQILTGIGIPEHFLAEGGDVNRATAAEMGDPVFRKLRARQAFFQTMLSTVFEFGAFYAMEKGRLSRSEVSQARAEDLIIKLIPDAVQQSDRAAELKNLWQHTQTVIAQVQSQLIDLETAREQVREMAEDIGLTVPPQAIEEPKGDPRFVVTTAAREKLDPFVALRTEFESIKRATLPLQREAMRQLALSAPPTGEVGEA